MKKIILLLFLVFFYFSGVLLADLTGVGTERGQDRTGSPVGSVQQCGQCHSGGNFGASVSLRLKDSTGTIVTEYIGGENYIYEVEVTGSSSKFGFQTVALLATNANAGLFTAQSANAKVITMNGRKYGEHVTAATSGLFIMNWTAPVAGSGQVKFYAAGNCVNGNNASSGDQASTATPLIINESAVSGFDEANNGLLNFYPNPVNDQLNILVPDDKIVNVVIYDATGRQVFNSEFNYSLVVIDFTRFEKGVYYIQLSGDIRLTRQIVY